MLINRTYLDRATRSINRFVHGSEILLRDALCTILIKGGALKKFCKRLRYYSNKFERKRKNQQITIGWKEI